MQHKTLNYKILVVGTPENKLYNGNLSEIYNASKIAVLVKIIENVRFLCFFCSNTGSVFERYFCIFLKKAHRKTLALLHYSCYQKVIKINWIYYAIDDKLTFFQS